MKPSDIKVIACKYVSLHYPLAKYHT